MKGLKLIHISTGALDTNMKKIIYLTCGWILMLRFTAVSPMGEKADVMEPRTCFHSSTLIDQNTDV